MDTTSMHRARIVAGPPAHTDDHANATPTQLRRQAALFNLHRYSGGAHDDAVDAQAIEAQAQPREPDTPADTDAPHDPPRDDDHGCSDDSNSEDTGSEEPGGHAADASGAVPESIFFKPATQHPLSAPHAASVGAALRMSTAAIAPAGPAGSSADTTQQQHELIDFIVARVADFCSNRAVLVNGHWHIRVPVAPSVLPGCSLTLTLSRFDLSLRFDTSDEAARQLIFGHETTLRKRLDNLMNSWPDGPRNIDVTVM
jgi:type III secretion control protein HpaP